MQRSLERRTKINIISSSYFCATSRGVTSSVSACHFRDSAPFFLRPSPVSLQCWTDLVLLLTVVIMLPKKNFSPENVFVTPHQTVVAFYQRLAYTNRIMKERKKGRKKAAWGGCFLVVINSIFSLFENITIGGPAWLTTFSWRDGGRQLFAFESLATRCGLI